MASSVDNTEELKTIIQNTIKEINKCIVNWFRRELRYQIKNFNGCCKENELQLLVDCYNIFSKNTDSTSLNHDFLIALIKFYYIHHVFDYDIHSFVDEKFLQIIGENKSPLDKKNIYFTDNMGDGYIYYWSPEDSHKKYIEIEDPDTEQIYYVNNKHRDTDPYIYKDEDGKKKLGANTHMTCFYDMVLDTNLSKKYLDMLTLSDDNWVSKIRRKILNFNPVPFIPLKNSNGTPFDSSTKLPVRFESGAPKARPNSNLLWYKGGTQNNKIKTKKNGKNKKKNRKNKSQKKSRNKNKKWKKSKI
jgi:hypothetical protein